MVVLIYLHKRRKSETKQSEADYVTEAYKREPGTTIPVEMDVNNTVELENTPKRPAEMHADFLGDHEGVKHGLSWSQIEIISVCLSMVKLGPILG